MAKPTSESGSSMLYRDIKIKQREGVYGPSEDSELASELIEYHEHSPNFVGG